jgi:hypothetical protein
MNRRAVLRTLSGIPVAWLAGGAVTVCATARRIKTDVTGACRGIDMNSSVAAAWKAMSASGVIRIESSEIELN